MKKKNIYIIAGPNGSGKTTFALKFLPDYAKCQNFINTDLIAQGLSPFSPKTVAIKAGKLVLEQIKNFIKNNVDFAFETTLAGKYYIHLLRDAWEKKYHLHFFFLWIPTPELAIERIKDRVAEGGHDVPARDVSRRFYRGLHNFFRFYKPLADSWVLFNNSENIPVLIAKEMEGKFIILDEMLFKKTLKHSGVNYEKT
ncbi:MAG: zeta toxin family protein [Elusimicrobiota bacterium]